MGCACDGTAGVKTVYVWSNDTASRTYNTEVEAQARKNKDGGNYRPVAG